jgi:hypothetical protein
VGQARSTAVPHRHALLGVGLCDCSVQPLRHPNGGRYGR